MNIKYKIIFILLLFLFLLSFGIFQFSKKIFKQNSQIIDRADISNSAFQDQLWIDKIRKGGFILHVRHYTREREPDVQIFDAIEILSSKNARDESWGKFTCLNAIGINEAKIVNRILSLSDIKISKVISSPSCRAKESAFIAFGKIDEIWNSLLHRTAIPPRQFSQFAEQLKADIANLEPTIGSNIVLVGHGQTLSYNQKILFESNPYGDRIDDARDMGGVVVMELTKDKKLYVRHVFGDIWNFTQSIIDLPHR
jgi:phosphohistidine phosphatase SixA